MDEQMKADARKLVEQLGYMETLTRMLALMGQDALAKLDPPAAGEQAPAKP